MRPYAAFVIVLAAGIALSACTSVKRATGQLDDSVLPGERENVLPPEQQTARDPQVTGQGQANSQASGTMQGDMAECLPEEPDCITQKPVAPAKPKKATSTIQ